MKKFFFLLLPLLFAGCDGDPVDTSHRVQTSNPAQRVYEILDHNGVRLYCTSVSGETVYWTEGASRPSTYWDHAVWSGKSYLHHQRLVTQSEPSREKGN